MISRTTATARIATRAAFSTARGNDPLPRESLISHAPGWREDLATASEASVKADREVTSLHEMQQKTAKHLRHDSDAEQTHAPYAREEISGPLGSAGMGEFEGVVGNDDLGPDNAQVEPDGRLVARGVAHKKGTAPGPDHADG